MTVSYDFGPEHNVVTPPNIIAEISGLVDQAAELYEAIDNLQNVVAANERMVKDLVEKQIPAKMELCGIKEITTASGYKVKLEKQLFASIPSPTTINKERDKNKRAQLIKRRNDAIKWLEDNNHGDIVKREITIQLGKDQAELSHLIQQVVDACVSDAGAEAHLDESVQVHHKTLASLVQELRDQRQAIPEDLLGVHEPAYATVSR